MITLAKEAGFCPGVKRAVNILAEEVKQHENAKCYTLGALIHNQNYIDQWKKKGVYPIKMEELPDLLKNAVGEIILFLRTHGISKQDYAVLESYCDGYPFFHYVDLTCPSVLHIHQIVEQNANENSVLFLFGDENHPECVGTLSFARGEKYVFCDENTVFPEISAKKTVILCSQTTGDLKKYQIIKEKFKKLYTNLKIFDTICRVTQNRQTEAEMLSRTADKTVVVGSPLSANTQKLYEICKSNCFNTFLVENASQLPPVDFSGKQNVLITAGASTPDGIILEVKKAMENFESMLEESLISLHTGDTVTGTVYAVTAAEIFLDLGAKFTGVIAKEQITADPGAKLADMFKVGDSVTAFVIRVEDGKGVATLSKKRVDEDNGWIALKEAFDAKTTLNGSVTAVVKGGVTMNIGGNRVFVPASQTGIAKDGDLSVLVGNSYDVRIIDFDDTKKKALASIKAIANEIKAEKEAALLASLSVGQKFHGTIKNLTPYGAFVDLGGIDGMIHNSELSWKKIKHPSAVVSVGQEVDVIIKEIDLEKKRISLGYKTPDMDLFTKYVEVHKVGDIVSAKIVAIMPFGAFGEVAEDVDGLIHISRLSTKRVNNPADVVKIGDVVNAKIVEIDTEGRKLALSIRAIMEEEEKKAAQEAAAAEKAAYEAERAEEAKKLEEERADMAPYIVGTI